MLASNYYFHPSSSPPFKLLFFKSSWLLENSRLFQVSAPMLMLFHLRMTSSLPLSISYSSQRPNAVVSHRASSSCGVKESEKVLVAQSCPTLYDSMDCSPPGSSVHGILQARTLEWVDLCNTEIIHSYTNYRYIEINLCSRYYLVISKCNSSFYP